jgi:tetratricopeptide (TPR) repeat protein
MKAAFSMRAVLAILGGLLASCASTSKQFQFTPDQVVADLATRVPENVAQKVVVPYDINDEIRELARKSVESLRTDSEKTRARQRHHQPPGMSISYDWLSNKTAQQVFYEGRGNCLAYSNLFIGMAREVGLDAVYVDVTTIERISKEAEVIVNNGHITAGIRTGPDLVMIDFTRTPEREYMGAKVIDDFEAIANYYNNQGFLYGYYSETAGDMGDEFDPAAAELEMYQMALDVRPDFGRARNNLGVAFRRRGRVDDAIAQYKLALEEDPKFAEARSNLGAAYYSQGRIDDAIHEFENAARTGGSNAYFYHHLGVIQYQQGHYEEALQQFKKAISRDGGLADARYYLGETYMKLGDREKAIEAYRKTLEVDPNYLSARAKLDLLVTETNSKSD